MLYLYEMDINVCEMDTNVHEMYSPKLSSQYQIILDSATKPFTHLWPRA